MPVPLEHHVQRYSAGRTHRLKERDGGICDIVGFHSDVLEQDYLGSRVATPNERKVIGVCSVYARGLAWRRLHM